MVRLVICGAAGRMGRRLIALGSAEAGLTLSGAVEKAGNPAIGSDAGEIAGIGRNEVKITDDLRGCVRGGDVVVAFVNDPAASVEQAKVCSEAGRALVIGTTGLTAEQDKEFAEAARGIAVVKTSNFSVGVTVLRRVVEQAAGLLGPDFHCEIVEAHHTMKKDAPSGTALSLAQAVARARNWDPATCVIHGRSGLSGERPQEQIGVHALRGGDIVGQHQVLFAGIGESLELGHRAQSRDTFAMGALRAAKWVTGQPAGLYDMFDVLGLT